MSKKTLFNEPIAKHDWKKCTFCSHLKVLARDVDQIMYVNKFNAIQDTIVQTEARAYTYNNEAKALFLNEFLKIAY